MSQPYASIIFLRYEEENEIYVQFIIIKTRVSALKGITIPKLELMECILVSLFSKYVVEEVSLKKIQTYWTLYHCFIMDKEK